MKVKISLLILIFALISSCASRKEVLYFQFDNINQENVNNNYSTIFKADDLLQINVSSSDIEAVKPFNLSAVSYALSSDRVIGEPTQQSYLIDNKGYIHFPLIGKIKMAGLTRDEAIEMLKNKIYPDFISDFNDININIRITNFKVTILGDVLRPGSYIVPNERITILEAIALAGDLNITANRENILIQREEGDKKNVYKLDLLSSKIFNSDLYYLQQNDLIYVEPNKSAIQGHVKNPNSGLYVSTASIIISLLTLALR